MYNYNEKKIIHLSVNSEILCKLRFSILGTFQMASRVSSVGSTYYSGLRSVGSTSYSRVSSVGSTSYSRVSSVGSTSYSGVMRIVVYWEII